MDPITIPSSCARTSGVNQAVSPSKIPRNPPTSNPSTTLFISRLLRQRAGPLQSYSTLPENPLTNLQSDADFRSAISIFHTLRRWDPKSESCDRNLKRLFSSPQNKQSPHHQIRHDQQNPGPIPDRPSPQPRDRALGIGADRQPIQIVRYVVGQLLNRTISLLVNPPPSPLPAIAASAFGVGTRTSPAETSAPLPVNKRPPADLSPQPRRGPAPVPCSRGFQELRRERCPSRSLSPSSHIALLAHPHSPMSRDSTPWPGPSP